MTIGTRKALSAAIRLRAINSELPFEPEIPFRSLADRLIPRITAAQFALVEPDFDASCAQSSANPRGGLLVL
jgi:hypothetical protein